MNTLLKDQLNIRLTACILEAMQQWNKGEVKICELAGKYMDLLDKDIQEEMDFQVKIKDFDLAGYPGSEVL